MTTKEAIEKKQIPTWKEWVEAIIARQEAKEARWESVGYRPPIR